MSSFDAGFATSRARLKLSATFLSIVFAKYGIGSGSKKKITFLCRSKTNNWNNPTISKAIKYAPIYLKI
jgi:hypothetical protein